MVNVLVAPTQFVPPFANVGVITILATMGAVVAFVAVKLIFPLPDEVNPIAVLSLVQE